MRFAIIKMGRSALLCYDIECCILRKIYEHLQWTSKHWPVYPSRQSKRFRAYRPNAICIFQPYIFKVSLYFLVIGVVFFNVAQFSKIRQLNFFYRLCYGRYMDWYKFANLGVPECFLVMTEEKQYKF